MSNRNRMTVVFVLLAVAFTLIGIWFSNREEAGHEEEITPAVAAHETPGKSPILTKSETNRTREGIAGTASTATDAPAHETGDPQTASARVRVRGRVVDLAGRGVPDLEITTRDAPLVVFAISNVDGSFDFEGSTGGADMVAASVAFATVRAMHRFAGSNDGVTVVTPGIIVVAPVVAISGVVVDESGLGLQGAHVEYVASDYLLSRFPLPLDSTVAIAPAAIVCDAGGAFSSPRTINADGAQLQASADGLESASIQVPSTPRSDVRIVLKKKQSAERLLTGVVVRANGDAATHAHVRIGEATAATDAHGAFKIALPEWLPEEQSLVAVESGSQAAHMPEFGRIAQSSDQQLAPVRLVLGPAPLSIRGKVVDAHGNPLPGWIVTIAHGTPVSFGRIPAITAEGLTAGTDGPTTTDDHGAFTLDGLLDREYELCAYSDESLARIESKPIKAGKQDVELVLPADTFEPKVTGRVVASDGTPIAGADVSIGLVTGREQGATGWISGKATKTDADGTFAFTDVPRRFAQFDVDGEFVIPTSMSLEGVDLTAPVKIEVARRCHFRVEGLPQSPQTRWLTAHDAQGQELQLMIFQGGGWSSTNRQQVTADATRVYGVSERAIDLVLDGLEDGVTQKRPLRLVPGDVTLVKW